MAGVVMCADSLPLTDAWRWDGVHWHAYAGTRDDARAARPHGREARLAQAPEAVLTTPDEVADWIDGHIREHLNQQRVWAIRDNEWICIGDEDDRARLWKFHAAIAS